MSDKDFDVIVIGAGPAGSIAAYVAARNDLKTLLIEKESFPRYKVCGSSLSPLAVRILNHTGLEGILSSSVALQSMNLFVRGCRVPFHIYGRYSISRERFDEALVTAANNAGARVLFNSIATIAETGEEFCTVAVKDKQKKMDLYSGKLIMNASGLVSEALSSFEQCKSIVCKDSYLGFGTTITDSNNNIDDKTFIRMDLSDAGYVGATKLPDNRINLAAAIHKSIVKQLPFKSLLLQSAQRIIPEITLDSQMLSWSGVPELKRRRSRHSLNRVISIGDAAAYVEPFTGEGIGWALYSGKVAADLAIAERCSIETATKWKALHTKYIEKRQRQTRLVGDLLKSQLYQETFFKLPLIGKTGTKLAYRLYRYLE